MNHKHHVFAQHNFIGQERNSIWIKFAMLVNTARVLMTDDIAYSYRLTSIDVVSLSMA